MIQYPFDLPTAWFLLVGVLLTGYAILDGFDLGAGALHLFAKSDRDRRIILNAIGPVWDGNEVWLLTGGGALFAAFPDVYATVFSGFYLAFMLVLLMMILRAVSIEFRSKEASPKWRKAWDITFSVSSIVLPILMGVALGNIVMGLPLSPDKEFSAGFFFLLRPYPLVLGITTLALFTMHGSIYLAMKTEGEFRDQVMQWTKKSMVFYFVMLGVLTIATFVFAPHMLEKFKQYPWLAILPVLNVLALANVPRELHFKRDFLAMVSSACSIIAVMALFGIGIFPNIVLSAPNPALSLTIANSASSLKSLTIMMTIAILGVPFVLAYTIGIYWVFRGKVDPNKLHY